MRFTQIAQSLRDLIVAEQLPPGTRLPSETVLAAQWGVCRMTAHRALSELEREGLVHRKRRVGTIVLAQYEACKTSAIEANGEYARFPISPEGKKRVALLGFHMGDFPQSDYVRGFRDALPADCELLICDTQNRGEVEAQYLHRLESAADAFCLYPTGAAVSTPLLRRIAESNTPIVCVDRVPTGLESLVDGVVSDNYGVTRQAVRFMQERGHRHVALLVADDPGVSSLRERMNGWRDACLQSGESEESVRALVRRFPPGLGYNFPLLCQMVHDALYTLR